jgi:peptidyl-prolyl cis-trans isomerase SurA
MRQFFLLVLLFVLPVTVHAQQGMIAAVVNEDPVTVQDLTDRMHLVIVTSGMPNTDETRARMGPQILIGLINETLQLQEAERLGIEVTQEQIDAAFANLAARNKLEPEQFRRALVGRGVNMATLDRQLEAGIAWEAVAAQDIRRTIRITQSDIDAHIERMRSQIGTTEYMVSEIFLPVDKTKDEVKTRQLAQNVVKDLRASKVPFSAVAQQLSQAPGAQQGGSLGWVQADQFDEKTAQIITNLDPGTVSDPIRSYGGYHIYGLQQKRVIAEENIPSEDQIRQSLFIQQLNRLANRRLVDLRNSAYIDERL